VNNVDYAEDSQIRITWSCTIHLAGHTAQLFVWQLLRP